MSLKTNIFILFIIDTSKSEKNSVELTLQDNNIVISISHKKYLVTWKLELEKVGKPVWIRIHDFELQT